MTVASSVGPQVKDDAAPRQSARHPQMLELRQVRHLRRACRQTPRQSFELIRRAGKSHPSVDALSRMPRPGLESECCHCLRKERRDEDTTETVRVVGGIKAKSKSLRDKQLADPTMTPVLKWVALGRRPSLAEGSVMNEDGIT